MKNLYYIVLALVFAVGVAACGGGASVKDAPVDEQSTSSAETGTADSGSATGESISEESTQMVAMAGERPTVMRVHFEFDSSAIDSESQALIEAHAAYLADNPDVLLGLEGHADERGTREYNLALGERRGQAVRRILRLLGIDGQRLTATSYGEENPIATEHNESAWRLNRRVEFMY
ncbi:MAG: peptidoglycan-associated lipoprotein Pal [Gammaproteobacteria bacterium]|nr:peptidoglycan-associated lipoprotein Pal [Pseudomonadota bacterium]MCZ6731581.1 peptidoglycan-associated lipoprotein Pal [Gammaproteobacteria bacterium]TDJ66063.1 MAG: peptidoglycan-associated lipoprotein Pal [Pseudomonadota bacterium]TDJ72555.1 MAG: peptidoglycan-associated lipoprotein Pal [Pseudomonadota bacterium]